jgi:hypothetical protein
VPDATPTDDGFPYRRSSFSGGDNCVSVAFTSDDVRVRHSRRGEQGTLVFSRSEWAAFIAGVKAAEFELP